MNDQVLVRYLLGLLASEEAERLDEACIVDDVIAARLRTVEDDLVDSYVRGTLSDDLRARFESHYLSSPRHRELVTFARSLAPVVDRVGASPQAAAPRRSTFSIRFRPSILAAAAALLLVASGALWLQTVRLKQAPNAPPNQPLAAAAVQEAPAIALQLLPQTRSIGSIPTLSIPAGADSVGVVLRLESIDFPRYQVGLRDPVVNSIVWRSEWLAATSSGREPSLRITLPAGALKPQHYSFDLSGQQAGGGSQVVGSYAFEIVPR